MPVYVIIILIFCCLFFIGTGIGIYFIFKYYQFKKSHSHDAIKKQYDDLTAKLHAEEKVLDEQILAYRNKLVNLSHKSENEIEDEIKKTFMQKLSLDLSHEIKEYKQTLEENKVAYLSQILVDSYQNILEESIHQSASTMIKLEDVNLKGRIIGKDGRNKKVFEYLTGVDLVIDKVSEYITIASLNPLRRALAVDVMNALIKSKNIEPAKIESCYEQESQKFHQALYDLGKEVSDTKLHAYHLNEKIYPYIGRLNYRSSYSQNILSHSLECAYIAQHLANIIGVDPHKAKLAAFFHDIGKSIDFEIDKNHIDGGMEIATECHLDDYIVEAIKTHHNEGVISSIYSEITKIADAISASRPGARIDSYDDYIKRVQQLESICNQFEEVNNSYVIKSGRQLRVMVNPKKVANYESLEVLSFQLKQAIESHPDVGTYKIKVILIKEDKLTFETSQSSTQLPLHEHE